MIKKKDFPPELQILRRLPAQSTYIFTYTSLARTRSPGYKSGQLSIKYGGGKKKNPEHVLV